MAYKRIKIRKYFNVLFLLMICACIYFLAEPARNMLTQTTGEGKLTIVIDPGHGGFDPGKVGVTGALEKDINLSIALKLKKLLEENDVQVIMTRETDVGLYSEGDSNKKANDMRKRVELINTSDAVIAVSIHQNSFTQEKIKGAQVFYYTQSPEGKAFASIMQKQLKDTLKDGNKREAKSNDNYYMLKKTVCPIIIVECGYLSNYEESALLVTEDYQEKLAWAIHLGIMSYINEQKAASAVAGNTTVHP